MDWTLKISEIFVCSLVVLAAIADRLVCPTGATSTSTVAMAAAQAEARRQFACFNTVLEIECEYDEHLIFESAHYGRNDTAIAEKCGTPFQRTCDVDARFTLNRLCSGQATCAVSVSTQLFGDPCGYEEFMVVRFRCVPMSSIVSSCENSGSGGRKSTTGSGSLEPAAAAAAGESLFRSHYDHGFVASPNYPRKYYNDALCIWKLSVQARQNILITIYDFELDVKRNGGCLDYLEIRHEHRIYFKDCGPLGLQKVKVDSNKAEVRFHTNTNSLTQRGFIVYFQALGPGCPDVRSPLGGRVEYEMLGDRLFANVTCPERFEFNGTGSSSLRLTCIGSDWNRHTPACLAAEVKDKSAVPATPPAFGTTTEFVTAANTLKNSGSIIGVTLGVISALLLIVLLLVLSVYLHRTRRAERKLDHWRVVINNLQENAMTDDSEYYSHAGTAEISLANTPSNNRSQPGSAKSRRRKNKNLRDDELQARNLLGSPYLDNDDFDFNDSTEKDRKGYDEDNLRNTMHSRRASRSGGKLHCDVFHDLPAYPDFAAPNSPKIRDPLYHSPLYAVPPQMHPPHEGCGGGGAVTDCLLPTSGGLLASRVITQSAPDILECLQLELYLQQCHACRVRPRRDSSVPRRIARSTTLSGVHAFPPHRAVARSRSGSRSKIRC